MRIERAREGVRRLIELKCERVCKYLKCACLYTGLSFRRQGRTGPIRTEAVGQHEMSRQRFTVRFDHCQRAQCKHAIR